MSSLLNSVAGLGLIVLALGVLRSFVSVLICWCLQHSDEKDDRGLHTAVALRAFSKEELEDQSQSDAA